VPLDGSSLAEEALPPAEDLARRYGATLLLVRAVDMTWLLGQGVLTVPLMLEEAEGYLRAVASDLKFKGIATDTTLWRGPAAPSIIDAAASWGADLIVMTTHGRGGIGRLVMGSVADYVLHRTTTPILLVHATGAVPARPAGEARAAVPPAPATAPSQP
jgi:nucleotide-binding universal stress UspA family protein